MNAHTVPRLSRRLTLFDAVALGLGSMIGAGVFSAFAPAAAAAGWWLLAGLAVAGVIALFNAFASAQLAAQFPTSGGTYVYGREQIGPWAGFFAGWSFVIGKTASSAAVALTFAYYMFPAEWAKPVAVAAVLLLTVVNVLGITKTAFVTKILVAIALIGLVMVIVVGVTAPTPIEVFSEPSANFFGVLQAAGFLFFAFAGYARIATLGEEVIRPKSTIPRAILIALLLTLFVYTLAGYATLHALGPGVLATSAAPLEDVAALATNPLVEVAVRIAAAAATLGALVSLIAGIGRTTLAMARNDDVPRWFSSVHARFHTPHRAEITLGLAVSAVVLLTDVPQAIGFSSFGVLLYYFIANVSSFTQSKEHRRYPRWFAIAGAAGCLLLVVALPISSILWGVVVLGVGLIYRVIRRALIARSAR